jgi:hypothetical protein
MVISDSCFKLPEGSPIINHYINYGHLSVISTYNPIYRMYNPIYNHL